MQTKRIRPVILDQGERIAFVIIYLVFAYRMTQAFLRDGQLIQLLYLFDQFIVLIFFVLRRSSDKITQSFGDWFAGFAGSCLPLLIGPVSPEAALAPTEIAAFFLLFGMGVHLSAKLTLRRSFGAVAANRGIKASGPYGVVRHPMYLGYILSHAGILLAGPNIRNAAVILLCWVFFLWRINAEERLLSDDPDYREFARHTRFRLVPGVY